MTASADGTARSIGPAVLPSPSKEGSIDTSGINQLPSDDPSKHTTLRWLGKGNVAALFQKKEGRISSGTREGVEHAATDDGKARHASRGRQVALKVAQRAASLARVLASRNSVAAKGQPAINSCCLDSPSPSYSSSRSAIVPPRRAYSYSTYPTTSSIGQTLLMDSSRPTLSSAGTASSMPLNIVAPTSADALEPGTARRPARKGFSRLVQAYPDIAAEAHTLSDYACSLDHAGIRWYGRIYLSSAHLYFTGTGISLSSAAVCKPSSELAQQQQAATPPWSSAQYKSSISLASAPPLSQEHSPLALRSRRPLHGPYSQPPRSQPTRLTFSMDEIPQQIQQAASNGATSQLSRKSNTSDVGVAKPLRRTAIRLALPDITRVTKELTLGIWPNAMTVSTSHRQYIFTNFLRRDKAYQSLYDVWTSNLVAPLQMQLQSQRRTKQRPHIPEQYTVQPTEESASSTTLLGSSLLRQNPRQSEVAECVTATAVAPPGGSAMLPDVPPSVELSQRTARGQASANIQGLHPLSPQQHNSNNNVGFMWQHLDPVMLVSQLIGIISRSTLFILLSLLVFCLLSSITFL